MNESYLSIGTNIGDKHNNLKACSEQISKLQIEILNISSIYLTDALEDISQPRFYNIVMHIRTVYSLDVFFKKIKNIEFYMGRPVNRKKKFTKNN